MSIVLIGVAAGQVKPAVPIRATVCELIREPVRFNGKLVQVRGTMRSEFERGGLEDGGCSLLVSGDGFPPLTGRTGEYAYVRSSTDLAHPEKLNWKPIQLPPRIQMVKDAAYQEFERYAFQNWKRIDGSECFDCPVFSIDVTVTGRFDHVEDTKIAVRSSPEDYPRTYLLGFGHLSASRSRLVWQTVSDVVVKQIDWEVYANRK